MSKRMLIDDTRPEETRVVIVNGNKVEDVEFESSSRKQIKGNIYLAKVMRIEPSLQAAFVDYGGNRHGFLAFGEIHPDYYNISAEEMAAVDKEIDGIIEAKKQAIKERELERERHRAERAALAEERRRKEEEAKAAAEAAEKERAENTAITAETVSEANTAADDANATEAANEDKAESPANEAVEEDKSGAKKASRKKRILKKRSKKLKSDETTKTDTETAEAGEEKLKVLAAESASDDETVQEEVDEEPQRSSTYNNLSEEDVVAEEDDEDEDSECDFELQRKLMKVRKLFHRSKIQDVIKEGQILLVQVVKEERGNKGAALTTYLSLAGRYCVLMPNRIKSGGVSRKITNVSDRKRLKAIVKELPLSSDMSMIVRTAGEEKTKADIVRDYNYLIRSWNQIRLNALANKAPALIHEEGNLIKRALRDMYTKDISEIVVDGEQAYKMARDFVKILSPHNLKKIKCNKKGDIPLFQRFQVEAQLDKLHDTNVQLESGGYLVINPTEALVSIDVNSGRATKEKDLEETALKTNLEAADEIAKQLRMRNLAGLVVIDFIDMDEPKNNVAVEKRMKEAMKKDRARIQIAKMSCFGLLEISRQRMHSSFFESNYQICPHCHGKGLVRTMESGANFVLRGIEEEGIKNRSSRLNVFVPSNFAIHLLNQKRKLLSELEERYNMEIVICADDCIKDVGDYRIERIKGIKVNAGNTLSEEEKDSDMPAKNNRNNRREKIKEESSEASAAPQEDAKEETPEAGQETPETQEETPVNDHKRQNNGRRRDRRNRFDRGRRGRDRRNRFENENSNESHGREDHKTPAKEKSEAVILYNSHEDIKSSATSEENKEAPKGKTTWWRKLIKS